MLNAIFRTYTRTHTQMCLHTPQRKDPQNPVHRMTVNILGFLKLLEENMGTSVP